MSLIRYRLGNLIVASIATVIGFLAGLYIGRDSRQAAVNNRLPIWTIMGNNLHVGGLVILLGLISFGVGGLIVIAYNQLIFGATVMAVYSESGWGPIITGVLPHAFFELVATVTCGILGFEGWRALRIIKKRIVSGERTPFGISGILTLAGIAFGFYLLGAVIESVISYVEVGQR